MEVTEELKSEFDYYYFELLKYSQFNTGRSPAITSTLIGSILLPLFLFSTTHNLYIQMLLWTGFIYFGFIGIRSFPKAQKIMTAIVEKEKQLLDEHNLHYCGCKMYPHFISLEQEKLYNVKSDILFDYHSRKDYIDWRYQWRFEPKWFSYNFYKIFIFLFLINTLFTFYQLFSSMIIYT